jgi:hypothetical protein
MRSGMLDQTSVGDLGKRLSAVLDEVAGQDVDVLRSDQSAVWLRTVQRAINRLESERTRRVRSFDSSADFAPEDASSSAAWLSEHLHLTPNAAYAMVRTARRLEETPDAERAFASGDFGFVHAMIVSRTIEQVRAAAPRQCGQAERYLVEQARTSNVSDLGCTALNLRYQLDQDGFLEDENRRHRDRWLHLRELQNGSGAFQLEGRLDAEGGVTLRTALNGLMGPRSKDDDRSPGVRRVDAMVEIARNRLDTGDLPQRGGERPHVTLTAELSTLRLEPGSPAAQLDWRIPVSGEMARRLTCDALVTPIVMGPNGDPLHVGRARRTFPTALRKAVAYRDRGCAARGCERHPDDCQGHHVRHWADGGPTDLANAQLLCSVHHSQAHEGQWRPQRAGATELGRPPP